MSLKSAFLLLALLASLVSFEPRASAKKDSLLVYGDGFAFSVQELKGWKCLCDGPTAASLGANAVFVKKGKTAESSDALVRIRMNPKEDEKIEQDLQEDMDQYRKQYPAVHFEDFSWKKPKYRSVSKLFFTDKEFYEYVAYVTPGPSVPWMASVSMNVQKRRADPKELEAYEKIAGSLVILPKTADKKDPPKKPESLLFRQEP